MFLILIKKLIAKKRLINFKQSHVNHVVNTEKISTIGILNSNQNQDSNQILWKELTEMFSKEVKIQVMTYYENPKEILNNESSFSNKSFNILCHITDENLNQFVKQSFDLLVNFYQKENVFLALTSQKSQAKFQVGLTTENLNFNDLVVETSVNQPKELVVELQKYLKLMNKI
jgi:hypothetical protein